MDRLTEKLRPLEQRGELAIWADPAIKPAQKWLDEIRFALSRDSAHRGVALFGDKVDCQTFSSR
jgi:hypothetical protein